MATASWSHGLTGTFYPAWEAQDVFTLLAIKDPLVLCDGQTQYARSLYREEQGVH